MGDCAVMSLRCPSRKTCSCVSVMLVAPSSKLHACRVARHPSLTEKTALLAQLRQGCFRRSPECALDAAKTNLSSWQSSVGKGRTPSRKLEFAKLG